MDVEIDMDNDLDQDLDVDMNMGTDTDIVMNPEHGHGYMFLLCNQLPFVRTPNNFGKFKTAVSSNCNHTVTVLNQ